jgi:hypothetical protein
MSKKSKTGLKFEIQTWQGKDRNDKDKKFTEKKESDKDSMM